MEMQISTEKGHPIGMDSKTINKPVIDFRNRLIRPVAFDSQALGYSRYPDTPFMWQSLRIGELIKGNYAGDGDYGSQIKAHYGFNAVHDDWKSQFIGNMSISGTNVFSYESARLFDCS